MNDTEAPRRPIFWRNQRKIAKSTTTPRKTAALTAA
jgi:hypothetical protein